MVFLLLSVATAWRVPVSFGPVATSAFTRYAPAAAPLRLGHRGAATPVHGAAVARPAALKPAGGVAALCGLGALLYGAVRSKLDSRAALAVAGKPAPGARGRTAVSDAAAVALSSRRAVLAAFAAISVRSEVNNSQ